MIQKNRRNILIGISVLVSLVGLIVMFGWFIGSETIIRIHPDLTSMKFISAFLFFLCGLELFFTVKIFIDKEDRYYPWLIILSTITICIIVLCAAVVISPSLGYILDLLPRQKFYDVWARVPYMPSIVTLIIFLFISLSRVFLIYNYQMTLKMLPRIGFIIFFIGFLALIGNMFGIHALFFATKYSGGVAAVTSLLFVLTGIYYFLLYSLLKSRE